MALTFTIQGGTTPPPHTTPIAGGAFNGIGAHEGSLLSLMGEVFLACPPPPYENFCGHPCSMIVTKACMTIQALPKNPAYRVRFLIHQQTVNQQQPSSTLI